MVTPPAARGGHIRQLTLLPTPCGQLESSIAIATLLLATCSTARADPGPMPVAHRTMLQGQLGLLSLTHLRYEVEGPSGQPGGSKSEQATEINGVPRLGIGVGHAFTEHIMLHLFAGGTLGGRRERVSVVGSTDSLMSLEVLPSLRYIAGGPERRLRLFAGAGPGFVAEVVGEQGGRQRYEQGTGPVGLPWRHLVCRRASVDRSCPGAQLSARAG